MFADGRWHDRADFPGLIDPAPEVGLCKAVPDNVVKECRRLNRDARAQHNVDTEVQILHQEQASRCVLLNWASLISMYGLVRGGTMDQPDSPLAKLANLLSPPRVKRAARK